MANTIQLSRTHFIFAICLPLAVLIGYFLAEPLESTNLAVIFLVCAVLAVPVMMKWHYPLLVFSWNLLFTPFFLPGRPELWTLMTAVSLTITVVSRAVNHEGPWNYVPSVTKSLIFFAGVVIVTAFWNGGIGVRALGGSQFGGKNYFYLLIAMAGYFALASPRVPKGRAELFIGLFFLSGISGMVNEFGAMAGSHFHFLTNFFPEETGIYQTEGVVGPSLVRYNGFTVGANAVFSFLLARYGVRGILELRRPWRLVLLMGTLYLGLLGGFRSALILYVLTFAFLFYLEGLCQVKYLLALAVPGVLCAGILLPNVQKLPLPVQRALSILPINVDPSVRGDAQASSDWRLEMWRVVLPDVPKYLWKGKGYDIDPDDLFLTAAATARGWDISSAISIVAGDYHNGPLSVIMPFGLLGLVGFLWFLVAGFRVLRLNHLRGEPALREINAFLLASFVAKALFFFTIFGSLYSDMALFTGLVGFGVSLNGHLWPASGNKESIATAKAF